MDNGTVMAIEMIRSISNGKVCTKHTAYLRLSVCKCGIKMHQFVNKNEISDFPSADKVKRHRKHILIFIQCTLHVLHVQKDVLQHF
jgi:hypothetical protein